ncbi:MAG: hypothetical protein H7A21_10800 [Spirochaetales bacterium]|nr:hypothetical protein [Leptospiraceae bacterium]MCP5481912.1 hypothetical protein [Spirochaetales bacterium]
MIALGLLLGFVPVRGQQIEESPRLPEVGVTSETTTQSAVPASPDSNTDAPAQGPVASSTEPAASFESSLDRSRRLARESGFQDAEIDELHAAILSNLRVVILDPELPEYRDATEEPARSDIFYENMRVGRNPVIVRGGAEGEPSYLRVLLREGLAYETEQYPSRFIVRSHAFVFFTEVRDPHSDADTEQGQSPVLDIQLERILIQYYLVNDSGQEYDRVIRRMDHPAPGVGPLSRGLADNSGLLIEYYRKPSTEQPVWEGADGVPRPELGIEPEIRVTLGAADEPMPYERQVRILASYRRVLREIDRTLHEWRRRYELERELQLDRVGGFP